MPLLWSSKDAGDAFEEHPGAGAATRSQLRQLQSEPAPPTCSCDDEMNAAPNVTAASSSGQDAGDEDSSNQQAPLTVRFLVVGSNDDPHHYLNYLGDRFTRRADAWFERTGVRVESVRVGELSNVNAEIRADGKAKVYDGYVFLPSVTGDIADNLADLTDFVATNPDVHWPDIFRFNRDVQSVYNGEVKLLPCDGDVHSMFYRRDLLEEFDIAVPRTWDEYSDVAQFFHGRRVPHPLRPNETITMAGSCVERKQSCSEAGFFNLLVHSTSTQVHGTSTGAFFDPVTMEPLLGEAMAETLRHLENQARYGNSEDGTSKSATLDLSDACFLELGPQSCDVHTNVKRMLEGKCALTYFWGDIFARHLIPPAVVEGRLGVAPTPGVQRVLDRTTGQMVSCSGEHDDNYATNLAEANQVCPHGTTYNDIGRVSYAPYAAAGGWSAAVSAGVSSERVQAMADFFGHVCGKKESLEDTIPEARGTLFTGTDPYRASQFNISKWVERGYPRDATELYQATIESQLKSPNAVLDVRFPEASAMIERLNRHVYHHLEDSLNLPQNHSSRLAVAAAIADDWRTIIQDYDTRPTSTTSLRSIYQKSLNVYTPPVLDLSSTENGDWPRGGITAVVLGCSLAAALLTGILFFVLIKRERERSRRNWKIPSDDIRIEGDLLGKGAMGVILKGRIGGTAVAVKPSQHINVIDEKERKVNGVIVGKQSTRVSRKLTHRRIEEEMTSLVKLRHPHITQVVGAFVNRKSLYVVVEFVDHGSLSNMLNGSTDIVGREGLPFELQWTMQIAKGLEFLHGLPEPGGPQLHTDLRAANVLIDASYNAKLTNFKMESRVTCSVRGEESMLWTAPEVLNGNEPSTASDVYSFGILLFEILARKRPFRVRKLSRPPCSDTTTIEAEYFGLVRGKRISLPEIISEVSDITTEPPLRPEIPQDSPSIFRDMCVECWHKNPLRRPTMSEITSRSNQIVGEASLTKNLAARSSIFNSILPQDVQDKLSRNEKVTPQSYSEVSVIFSDVVGFTSTSSLLSAEEVGDMISRLFNKYDKLASKYGIKKLDVIGDEFLCVAGIPVKMEDHAARAACFALEAIEEASKTPISLTKPHLGCISIRCGLASGPVVIGGSLHPKYTLFGTTVNTSSRMESSSEPDHVQCTKETAELIKRDAKDIGVHFRKKMDIKGRGFLDTYYLSPPAAGFNSLRRKMKWLRPGMRGTASHSSSLGSGSLNTDSRRGSILSQMEIAELAQRDLSGGRNNRPS